MNSKIVLLVDDDCDDVDFFAEVTAEIEDIILKCSEDAIEGFKQLSAMEVIPALIVVDAGMPRMNGWEFIRLVKRDGRFREIPVIMAATSSRQKGIDEARDLGADAYIIKPSNFNDLSFLIRNICLSVGEGLKSKLLDLQNDLPENIFVFTEN
jgi:CheY-like chemotaxis protein